MGRWINSTSMRSVRRLSHPTADSWLAPGFQMIQPRLIQRAIERARPFVPEPLFGPLICQSPLFRLAPQLTRGIFLRHLSRTTISARTHRGAL